MWGKHQWANEAVFYHEKLSLWIEFTGIAIWCIIIYINLQLNYLVLCFLHFDFNLDFFALPSPVFRFSLIRYQKEERTKMHQSQLSRSADKAWVKGRKLQQGPHLNDPEQAKQKLLILIRQQTKKTLAPRET